MLERLQMIVARKAALGPELHERAYAGESAKKSGVPVLATIGPRCVEQLALKDNRQLYAFLEEHHFEIEHKAFPKRPRNETDESEELIVLVARKCVQA